MIQKELVPGMYLVGRSDGGIEPFFIKVTKSSVSCHEDLAPLMDHALMHKGWWLQLMEIPSHFDPLEFPGDWERR